MWLCALLLFILVISTQSSEEDNSTYGCADFNFAAAQAALAGLHTAYICPQDGISRVKCAESFPLKPVDQITQSHLTWSDIVIYVLVGPNSRTDAFFWWLQFISEPMDMVLVGDACPGDRDWCNDHIHAIQERINSSHPNVRAHTLRSYVSDTGYKILSCKLRSGMFKVYQKFPDRKYYYKIDTDTIVFPRRLFSFLKTLESTTNSSFDPLYFGTVVESGMNLLLCGRNWVNEGNVKKGGLCYGQGGAGYGLNNVAMKTMAAAPICSSLANPDDSPEDVFTGLRMYQVFKIVVIHCGGFRSSELVGDQLFKQSISFHYIDHKWLKSHGSKLAHHYTNPT